MAKTKTAKNKQPEKEQNEATSFDQQPTSAKDSSAGKRRKEKLTQDQNDAYIEIPDVSDIPGQENIINAGVPGAMSDTTIASDDEEGIRDGKDILAEDDNVDIVMGTEADVTEEDLVLLGDPDQDMDMSEDELVRKEGLDDTDFDGDPLNEAAVDEASTGDDLDMPEEDNEDARKYVDDEENDYYSLGSGDKDALNEGRRDE
ncbi:hypothetical protein FAM09_23870 [Niastella caeni]|uniref:Uncharacterized protein n=1 Tax=Niastella caeni TaxID=2569763 RepID=A0A4S8HM71_9BACT|nr:hypothetical protein [Niastella caeni]THU34062.1 hypothetical protein FAM09_23870 [Niastella caeni]